MEWATALLQTVYGPDNRIRVQHCVDTLGQAYFCVIRDEVNGNHVMIFTSATSLVHWCQALPYRVGDKAKLSATGERKAPHMAGQAGRVRWVSKSQVFSVDFGGATFQLTDTDLLPN